MEVFEDTVVGGDFGGERGEECAEEGAGEDVEEGEEGGWGWGSEEEHGAEEVYVGCLFGPSDFFFFFWLSKKLTYPNPSSDRKTSHAQINSLRSSLSGEPLVKTLSVTRVLSISPSIVFNRSGGKRPVARPLRARARYVLYISTLVGE